MKKTKREIQFEKTKALVDSGVEPTISSACRATGFPKTSYNYYKMRGGPEIVLHKTQPKIKQLKKLRPVTSGTVIITTTDNLAEVLRVLA